ncbi:MAG: tetratricopeptide repeat protein [Planctomycetes bacterium]|nr:tetratricopeptide repeat protein [Planctomycetota bacterium]
MSSSTSPRWFLATLLLLLGTGRLAAQSRIDVLDPRGQIRPLPNAVITSETLDEVKFVRGERNDARKTSDIVSIDYGRGSATFEEAQAALTSGDLTNAVNLFSAATRDTDPPWVASHALLQLAEIQLRRGAEHRAEALSTVEQFLTQYPEHRLLPSALLLEARIATSLSDRTKAEEAVKKVRDLAESGRITADWGVRASLQQGEDLLEAGQAREAGTAFGTAQDAAQAALANLGARKDLESTLQRLELEARTGAGSALLAGGDVSGARSYFERLQSEGSSDPAVAMAARNGLAQADFQDGDFKAAQVGFAQVAVKGAAIPDQHAKALYFLGRCVESLDDKGLERNGRAKALEYYKEVSRRYPGSRWARLAEQSLP